MEASMRYRFTDSPRSMTPINEPPQSTEGDGHHIHVHFDVGDAIVAPRGTTGVSRPDANANAPGEEMPAVRRNGNGNGPNGAQPRILARMLQDGETGRWVATDNEGNALEIRTANDGALEILHRPNEEQNGDADRDIVGTYPTEVKGEAGLRAGAAHDARAVFDAKALEQFQTRGDTTFGVAATRAYAKQIAEAFAPKRRS
jgi:hypothetical protein